MNKSNWIMVILGIISGLLGTYFIDKDSSLAIILLILGGYFISGFDEKE